MTSEDVRRWLAKLAFVEPECSAIRGLDIGHNEDALAVQDYRSFVSLGIVRHDERGWQIFRDGFREGGEIGRRRLCQSAGRPASARAQSTAPSP
jgi:hypothetical protein